MFSISFFGSLTFCVFVRHWAKRYKTYQSYEGSQRFHAGEVPRLGGLAMLVATVLALMYVPVAGLFSVSPNVDMGLRDVTILGSYLMVPVLIGAWEDLTQRVGVSVRLLTTTLGGLLAILLLDVSIERLGLSALDVLWQQYPLLGFGLALLAIAGLPHAFNIIDGYNGLAGFAAMIILWALLFMALKFDDRYLAAFALCSIGVTAGFLIWNYPKGLIFAGDGGAYFWGLTIALISILLVQRHEEVSPWFAVLLLIYPVWETIFSSYRKIVRGVTPGAADSLHLHHMVYRRMVRVVFDADEAKMLLSRNNRTTPYLIALTVLTVIPALVFWNNTLVLIGFCILFVLTYVTAYIVLVKFKIPRWVRKLRL